MKRMILTKEELRSWLSSKIQMIEGLEECEFGAIPGLRNEDENGCNWSPGNLFFKVGEIPTDLVMPYAHQIVDEAYKSFNISD